MTPEAIAQMQADMEKSAASVGMTLQEKAALREKVLGEIKNLQIYLQMMEWRINPIKWCKEKLGEHLWSKQEEIALSVATNRKTAVPSCFASGKSFLAARLVCWWIDIHPPGEAFVVTTATTASQVKAILWRELSRAHSKGGLQGRLNQNEWWYPMPDGREEMVSFGRKPADYDQTAFQGIHAKYVLVIVDEAAGVPGSLFDAAESLTANEYSRMLAIGNPEDATGEFAKMCTDGSDWNVIQITAFETPNFTDEDVPKALKEVLISKVYVEEKRKKWGEKSPMWAAKILAEFPSSAEDGLIPIRWIREAQDRDLKERDREKERELGVDVGGGGDKSVIASRIGGWVRIILRTNEPDTMKTLASVYEALDNTNSARAKIDEIGIGRGMVDAGRSNKQYKRMIWGINVGRRAKDHEGFANLRAEAAWFVRELFRNGDIDIDPLDEDLVAQLVEIRYKRQGSRIQIESKDEMKRRKIDSPDDFDAIVLAFIPASMGGRPKRNRRVIWG